MAPYYAFHEGEIAMQTQVGVRESAEGLRGMMQPLLKPGHAEFFSARSEAFVASVDSADRVWASVLFGDPGFVSAPSGAEVVVQSGMHPWDPLWDNSARDGAPLGFLFIELATRRRNRMNGVSVPAKAARNGLHVAVTESFGNCPKYIQRREIVGRVPQGPAQTVEELRLTRPEFSPALTGAQMEMVGAADFLSIASAASGGRGADMSHRGGRPGFVRVASPGDLWFPNYRGNNLFQTLGNLVTNPAAGLLFIDWERHATLQLSGRARVVFPEELQAQGLGDQFEAANCAVHFEVDVVLETPNAVPFEYEFLEYSPHSPQVASSDKLVKSAALKAGAQEGSQAGGEEAGYRGPVEVVEVRQVAKNIRDFRFRAPRPVRYRPGQFAAFDLSIPAATGPPATVNRSWTISSAPSCSHVQEFHISVKHKPGGLASTWLHKDVHAGTIVQFAGVDGDFTFFDTSGFLPKDKLLLLSAGVGITPMLSMLRGLRSRPLPQLPSAPLDVVFFHSARDVEDIPFLEELSADFESRPDVNVQFVTNLSRAEQELPQSLGKEHKVVAGRISLSLLQDYVPDLSDRQVYLCGPEAYMTGAESMLIEGGVAATAIHTEAFYF